MNLKESQVKLLTENPGSDQYNRLASQFSKEQLRKNPLDEIDYLELKVLKITSSEWKLQHRFQVLLLAAMYRLKRDNKIHNCSKEKQKFKKWNRTHKK